MLVFGTRPEAIKMCPVVKELQSRKGLSVTVCVTGQHREMLQQVLDVCILSIGNPQNCHQNSLFLEREFLVVVRTRFLHSGVLSGASMHAASDNFSRRT